MTSPTDLLEAAKAIAGQLVTDRRVIHQHPELGFQEHRTAALVAERLRGLGLEVRTGVAETGVIGLLRGSLPGKTILLRADMDALPLQEDNALPYASEVPGVMHACGHDAHVAILLGAAHLLAERRHALRGVVKFVFQPAEEGAGGASRMLEEGVLLDPPVDAAFGLHVWPTYPTGKVALGVGPVMAGGSRFAVTVTGPGGHAAMPHLTVDPVVVAAHIVVALQTIVSREIAPNDVAVVTVGSLISGTRYNVIPTTARIQGTMRYFRDETRRLIERRFRELAQGIGAAMQAVVDVEISPGAQVLVNDAGTIDVARAAVSEVLGADAVVMQEPTMAGEDFARVLQRVPGAFVFLGVRDPNWGEVRPNHSATFDLDEAALPLGVAVMAGTALRYLEGAAGPE